MDNTDRMACNEEEGASKISSPVSIPIHGGKRMYKIGTADVGVQTES